MALVTSHPRIGVTIMKMYSAQCISLASVVCQCGEAGKICGAGPRLRANNRSQTRTNTVRPSMKCDSTISVRAPLPLGKNPRNSIQA
ncbi:hypothetical protein D3C86_1972600 [compost metagenome]